MNIGPALPPSLKERRGRREDAESTDNASPPIIGPPLPPSLAATAAAASKGSGDGTDRGTHAAETAASGSERPPLLPGAAAKIGPPLPPGMVRGADAAPTVGPALPPGMTRGAGAAPTIGPALPPGMARGAGAAPAIGPALPPGMRRGASSGTSIGPERPPSAADCASASRKREWDRVRSAAADLIPGEASAGNEQKASHPGDEGREEWMTVPPVFDKRQSLLVAQGLGGLAPAPEGPKRPQGPPRRPGDASFEEQGDGESDSASDGADEHGDGERSAQKRVKYTTGPSLLEQHVSRADEVATRQEGQPRYRQFDREKEFTDHKKRDASFYAKKAGGLGSRYGPAQRGDK